MSLLLIRIQVVTDREPGYMFYFQTKHQSVNAVSEGGGFIARIIQKTQIHYVVKMNLLVSNLAEPTVKD
jgi:hypothetical protein